jgi:hypothetical protein
MRVSVPPSVRQTTTFDEPPIKNEQLTYHLHGPCRPDTVFYFTYGQPSCKRLAALLSTHKMTAITKVAASSRSSDDKLLMNHRHRKRLNTNILLPTVRKVDTVVQHHQRTCWALAIPAHNKLYDLLGAGIARVQQVGQKLAQWSSSANKLYNKFVSVAPDTNLLANLFA